jgi:hypothetical protein
VSGGGETAEPVVIVAIWRINREVVPKFIEIKVSSWQDNNDDILLHQ